MDFSRFDKVIHDIYGATLDASGWASALDGVASLSGSTGAIIYAKRPTGWGVPIHSQSVTGALEAYASENWAQRNPWLQGRMEMGFRLGDVYRDLDIVTAEEMESNPFYTDFLNRFDLGRQMVAMIYSDLGEPTCLVSHRKMSKGPFQAEEMQTHLLIARHLERSLQISSSFLKKDAALNTASAAFDAMDRPALIVNNLGRPIRLNQSATHLLGTYFVEADDQIKPVLKKEQAEFLHMLRNVVPSGKEERMAPRPITISNSNGAERIVVWAIPLVGSSVESMGLAKPENSILLLTQPLQNNQVIDPIIIRNVYGLTTGEARVASLLAGGRNVKQIAAELGLTVGTTRYVLNKAFQKMGVHRQSELITKIRELALPDSAPVA